MNTKTWISCTFRYCIDGPEKRWGFSPQRTIFYERNKPLLTIIILKMHINSDLFLKYCWFYGDGMLNLMAAVRYIWGASTDVQWSRQCVLAWGVRESGRKELRGVNTQVSLLLNSTALLPVAISAGLCGLRGICNEAYLHRKGAILRWIYEYP